MREKTWKRFLALFLALLCFFCTPLSAGEVCVKAADVIRTEETEKQTEEENIVQTEGQKETENQKEMQTELQTESPEETEDEPLQFPEKMARAAGDSIYVEARETGIRLDKSARVTVGNINTQLPAGYEAYFRRVDAPEISHKNKTFVPDYGAFPGKENCYPLADGDENKYYAWYRKSVYYKDTWIDLKMTLADFKLAKDNAYFRFSEHRPGIDSFQVEWADLKMEFFRSDNGEAISVKGYLTFRDIDLFQGIVLKRGFGDVYVTEAALSNIRTTMVNDNDYFYNITGIEEGSNKKANMLSALFSGSVIRTVYTFVRPENNVGTSLTPSGGILAEAYKIFQNEHPNIQKTVSDNDEMLKTENTLKDKDETFSYTLTTVVPMEEENTVYKDLWVYDTLDEFLEIKSVKVTNENGADASGWWNLTTSNQFEARCTKMNNTDFYGHTYQFVITVGIRKGADLGARWDENLQSAVIRNQAHAESDGKTVHSGIVLTKIPAVPSGVQVEKKDIRTGTLLAGAEFSVYEWNGSSYKTEPLMVLKNSENGIYSSGNILRYTTENQGKFKIAETKAPQGYMLENWTKEFTISGFSQSLVSFVGENACLNTQLWIRLRILKKDAETGKAAAGAVFRVYQWSKKAGTYVDMETKFQSNETGEAISHVLYSDADNLGKFQIQEIQAPGNYFGDYKDGKKENGLKTYEVQINSQNTGQTITLSNTENKTDFVNVPQKAKIRVKKQGEVLSGAKSDENGTVFSYEKQPLAGAEYEILAAEDIYKADGVTLAFKKGAVADRMITNTEGEAVSSLLNLGKYNVVETKAPKGYVLGKTTEELSKTVALTYRGQEVNVYTQEGGTWENARPKVEIRVQKKSKDTGEPLGGAEFGLYAGEHIRVAGNIVAAKDTLIEKVTSGTDGTCQFTADLPCGYDYYVKEICAPVNYYKQVEKEAYAFAWEYLDDKTLTYTFPEKDREEEAVFYNQEVRADIALQKLDAESNLAAAQQGATLEGAIYGLYAKEDILSPDGRKTVVYKKDTEVARAATDHNGKLYFRSIPLGNYYIKEIRASEGYLLDTDIYFVECSYEGLDIAVVKRNVVSKEQVKKQKFRIYKLTGDNKETDLEWIKDAGFSVFSVAELEKYAALKEGTYTGLEDEELVQKIIDDYRNKNTLDYSGMKGIPTATVFEKGENGKTREFQVPELFSDEKGILETCELPYGRYLLVETTVPKGKVAAAPKVLHVSSDGEDDVTAGDGQGISSGDLAIWDQPVTSFIKITKKDAFTSESVTDPGAAYVIHDVDGAYFQWYMKDKTSEEKLDYINRYGNLVVAYTNGEMAGTYHNPYRTEKRKDTDGNYIGTYVATTEMLPEGRYILEEIKAPEGYVKQGFEGTYRTRNDHTFFEVASLQLPSWQAVRSLKVTEEDVGKWEPSEKASVDQRVSVQIGQDNDNTTYDSLAGGFVTEVYQENEPTVGKLSVYAEGETISGWEKENGFTYEYRPVEGNTFLVRAAENIFSGEGTEKETLLFAKGSVVTELITDADGKAWTDQIEAAGYNWKGLPLGLYTIEQTKAAEGYVLSEENQKPRSFEIAWAGEEVPIVYQDALYKVARQKIFVQTKKKDAESKQDIAGAVFGLYAGQDIIDESGKVIVEKDTLLQTSETKEGLERVEPAGFTLDLPPAFYYIREEMPPYGYYSTGVLCEIDARYQREGGEILTFEPVFENQQTLLLVNIMDFDTEQELDGVEFAVLDEEGQKVCEKVTVHNGNALIRGLQPGKRYTIQETKARKGYQWDLLVKKDYHSQYEKEGYRLSDKQYESYALPTEKTEQNEAVISLSEVRGVQVVSLFNRHVTGGLTVKKEGEVPRTEIRKEKLAEISYEIQGLPKAEYDVVAEEDIFHPDGYSAAIYRAGETIGHLVTDEEGKAAMSGLFAGKYRVCETKAPAGYVRKSDTSTQIIEISWTSGEAPAMEKMVVFRNPRQIPDIGTDPNPGLGDHPGNPDGGSEEILHDEWKGKTGILKTGVDGTQEHPLVGAEFTLYAKKDVTDIFGNIVIPKGTEIESSVSDVQGRVAFLTDLPMGSYYAKETKAAEGYYLMNDEILFDFEPYKEQDSIYIVRLQEKAKNAITQTKIFLKDDLTGNELAGAVLEIVDEEGKVHSAVTTENTKGQGHMIKGLVPGKVYTIREKMPRSGYYNKILIPESMEGILNEKSRSEVTFSIPERAIDKNVQNMPGNPILEIQNAFLTGDVEIAKNGEILNSAERKENIAEGIFQQVKTWFQYIVGGIEKVEFSVFAANDIYHPDGVTGLLYKKGELVEQHVRLKNEKTEAKTVTDRAGKAGVYGLYPGQYVLEETNIPEGYSKSASSTEFTLADTGEDVDTLLPENGILTVYNERQRVNICVTKREKDQPDKVLYGAFFGLYAAEDIVTRSDHILLEKDTLLETKQTGEDGTLQFDSELPLAKYYVAELVPPAGYCSNPEILQIDAGWKKEGIAVQEFRYDFYDEITQVLVTKKASDTEESLVGAALAIYQGNSCITSWVTDGKEHSVEGLTVGETYILRETAPAPGYATAADIEFTVEDAKDGVYTPQKIEMVDAPTEVHISVYEQDGDSKRSLGKVKVHLETADGNRYTAPDGSHGGDSWESVKNAAEIWKKIPVGQYKAVTESVPEGYVMPNDVLINVQDTSEPQYFEILVQPVCIRITAYAMPSKAQENQTQKTVTGGVWSYISGMYGEISKELPMVYNHVPAGNYSVLTEKVPDGYVLPEKTNINVKGDTTEIQDFEVLIYPTAIKITAVDKDTQKTLDHVRVTVLNEKGKKVWKNILLPELKEKVIPADYTIKVVKVPKGYKTPENQKITVKAVKKVQKFKIELEKDKSQDGKTEEPDSAGSGNRSSDDDKVRTASEQHVSYGTGAVNGQPATAAKTGDATPVLIWLLLCLGALGFVLYSFRHFTFKKR